MDIFTRIYLEFDITAFNCQKLHLCACVILHTVESHISFVSIASLKLKVITTPEEQPSTERYIYIRLTCFTLFPSASYRNKLSHLQSAGLIMKTLKALIGYFNSFINSPLHNLCFLHMLNKLLTYILV